jgi:hypothetical protein
MVVITYQMEERGRDRGRGKNGIAFVHMYNDVSLMVYLVTLHLRSNTDRIPIKN